MMYLIFKKEQWEEFKNNTIEVAAAEEKLFVTQFFENAEKHGTWQEQELPE